MITGLPFGTLSVMGSVFSWETDLLCGWIDITRACWWSEHVDKRCVQTKSQRFSLCWSLGIGEYFYKTYVTEISCFTLRSYWASLRWSQIMFKLEQPGGWRWRDNLITLWSTSGWSLSDIMINEFKQDIINHHKEYIEYRIRFMDNDIVDNPMSLYNPRIPRSLLDIMMESIHIYDLWG